MRQGIHIVAYYLNLTFQYDHESFYKKLEVMNGFLDVSKLKFFERSRIFHDRERSFSRQLAIEANLHDLVHNKFICFLCINFF